MHRFLTRRRVSVVIINMRGDSKINSLKKRVKYRVLQDTKTYNIWSKFGGQKDDFFVLNKCGRITAHLKSPFLRIFRILIWKKIQRANTRCGNYCGSSNIKIVDIPKITRSS